MPATAGPSRSLARRLAWFVGLWVGSVVALAIVAFAIKLLLSH